MAQSVDAKVKKFFKILSEDLHFQKATKISSAKMSRLFENPAVGLFLTEFINIVSSENVLTDEEVNKFSELSEQGKAKSGLELQMLLDKIRKQNTDAAKRKDLLEQKIYKINRKKERLEFEISQMENMEQQQSSEVHDASKKSINELQDGKVQMDEARTLVENTQKSLNASFQNLCKLIEGRDQTHYLISQTMLKDLVQAEEEYNVQLTSFVKKQFNKISTSINNELMRQGEDQDIYSIADNSILAGESEEVRQEIMADIKRAQLSYTMTEKRVISARAREAAANMSFKFLNEKLSILQEAHSVPTADELRVSLDTSMKESSTISKDVSVMTQIKIPAIIEQSIPLQAAYFLTGDYAQKQARQEYFIGKQQRVISLLLQQRGRLDLLWVLLAAEEAGHRKTAEQIPAILYNLQSVLGETQQETEIFLKNMKAEEAEQPLNFISEHDSTAIHLHEVLCHNEIYNKGTMSIFKEFDAVKERAEKLRNNLESARKSETTDPNADEEAISKLLSSVSNCEALLSPKNGSTDADDIILTPAPITQMMETLHNKYNELTDSLRLNLEELEKKTSYLEYQKDDAFSQNLWLDFMLHPQQLQQKIDEYKEGEDV